MKRLLLLLVATCFIFVANAQKATETVLMNQKKLLHDSEYQGAVSPVTFDYSIDAMDSRDKIYVGKAHSQRSFRREECKNISYNKDLDLISISFILDAETYPTVALSNGSVGIFYSADHGQTWDGPVLLSDLSAEGLVNYYLSSVIYNPTDNDVIENAYGVYQGVAPNSALTLWNNQAFGSSTFGGANYFTEYFENNEPGHEHDGYFSQYGLTQIDDFMKCFNIWAEGPWAGFTELKMEDIHGTFNGTGFDWDLEHSVIDMPFNLDPTNNFEALWVGRYTFSDGAADMVWSDDGEIGYAWMVGSTSENLEAGFQPIIFKTTDGGNNWDYIELDFQQSVWQDFFQNGATVPTDWLILPCQLGGIFKDHAIPWFNASVGAVDAEGNLQLFGTVSSHSYDLVNGGAYYDSLFWKYNFCGNLFKFTIGDELIDIMLVDTLATNAALDLAAGNDSLYCRTNGWLNRLQLSKDERSEEFFLTWTDSEGGNRVQQNYQPDIRGWSYNITTGEHTDPVCFTCGTTFPFEHYWYVQASDRAYYNSVDQTFTVPMVNAVSLNDFFANKSASADPVDVEYVTGITFDALVPIGVGVDEFSKLSQISVSQNLPNPATGITTIEISSKTVAPVTVEVTNIIGQIVRTIDAGIINGNIKVDIDVSNLKAGVYLYTVVIANERVSKRMIVR